MVKWKTKALNKLSVRQRERLGIVKDTVKFGKISTGQGRSLDHAVDRFIRESSCRHKQSLGKPCESFDDTQGGVCRHDGRICDLLTQRGERYLREFE